MSTSDPALPITASVLTSLTTAIVTESRRYTNQSNAATVAAMGQMFLALAARIKAIDARLESEGPRTLADAYMGVWEPGVYERGVLVTHGGGLWISTCRTDSRPGGEPGWVLCVKAGNCKHGRERNANY
jgi:hypothetical protein